MYFLLRYEVVDDYLTRRAPLRAEHRARAGAAGARGELRLGGALDEPADEAVLVFRGEDATSAEAFARADPYVREGLVRRWSVRRWNVVIGADLLPDAA